ncbi:hypothetical protein [Shouchella hunanensis]|uniref:Uncharacterized protein n=1 Tax=Shouchella hunanensis TaxID=766894 RepID=A0ABY7W1Y2_9BACI|nr:hypothetical protein [Shouchella hunanensis]WDF02942.1 hypothetical protein PQ477_15760 [Shouchella hunanensis]
MTEELANEILQQLRDGEIKEYRVEKNAFNVFRLALVAQEDMKNFRGNAQHKGAIIYTYEPGWTA